MRAFASFVIGASLGALIAFVLAPPSERSRKEEWDIVDEASAESAAAAFRAAF